jgi:hypothetical protein
VTRDGFWDEAQLQSGGPQSFECSKKDGCRDSSAFYLEVKRNLGAERRQAPGVEQEDQLFEPPGKEFGGVRSFEAKLQGSARFTLNIRGRLVSQQLEEQLGAKLEESFGALGLESHLEIGCMVKEVNRTLPRHNSSN